MILELFLVAQTGTAARMVFRYSQNIHVCENCATPAKNQQGPCRDAKQGLTIIVWLLYFNTGEINKSLTYLQLLLYTE